MRAKPTGREWRMRVADILNCIDKIDVYTRGMTFEQFKDDQKTIDAVIRNFEIIGEAVGFIPEPVQERFPEIAWLEMRGMRNIMIHEYFGVSLSIIWQTVIHDLPILSEKLKKILPVDN